MADEAFRVAELSLKGRKCSHTMAQIGLDAQEKTNPSLLRALSGLTAGMDVDGYDQRRGLPLMHEEFVDRLRDEYTPSRVEGKRR